MKKVIFWVAMFSMALALGLVLTGCGDSNGGPIGLGDDQTGDNGDGTGDGGDQTGGNGDDNGNGSGGGKVTITLSAGSGTGNIKLKLSEGTWNASGPWSATESSNLNAIMNSLLTIYPSATIVGSQCTATIIESNTALNIELRDSDGLLELSGEVHVATLNPVTFPYTSHENVLSLSEKFQAAGGPVSFVNKTRLYTDGSAPWTRSSLRIVIRESQIEFMDTGTGYFSYAYNIDSWKSDYVGGQYCATIDVSNGRSTSSGQLPPACITGKTSFTFRFESWNGGLSIRQANGEAFSGTNGWQYSFTK
jgi:hypothetical protein